MVTSSPFVNDASTNRRTRHSRSMLTLTQNNNNNSSSDSAAETLRSSVSFPSRAQNKQQNMHDYYSSSDSCSSSTVNMLKRPLHKQGRQAPASSISSPICCLTAPSRSHTKQIELALGNDEWSALQSCKQSPSNSKRSSYKPLTARITQIVALFMVTWIASFVCFFHQTYFLDQLAMIDTTGLGNLQHRHVTGRSDGGSSSITTTTTTSRMHGPVVGPPLVRPSIPLPLPKEKVSVILMNFSRPRMIRESSMMRTLLNHPTVDEVLLLHSNPKTAFEFVHPKVVNIDAIQQNEEMGLSLRFYFCQLAKNDWVMHLDDDMEFTPAALDELFIEYGRNPQRIVGRYGRNLELDNSNPLTSFNGYSSSSTHKSTEVVLTKLMVMERETCSAFFQYSHLLWDDIVLHDGEGPLWNGEDIFMSLVANHIYGPPKDDRPFNNYAMDWLDVWQADDSLKDYSSGKLDISGGLTGYTIWDWKWWQTLLRRNRHYSYRGKLWQTARERLSAVIERHAAGAQ